MTLAKALFGLTNITSQQEIIENSHKSDIKKEQRLQNETMCIFSPFSKKKKEKKTLSPVNKSTWNKLWGCDAILFHDWENILKTMQLFHFRFLLFRLCHIISMSNISHCLCFGCYFSSLFFSSYHFRIVRLLYFIVYYRHHRVSNHIS